MCRPLACTLFPARSGRVSAPERSANSSRAATASISLVPFSAAPGPGFCAAGRKARISLAASVTYTGPSSIQHIRRLKNAGPLRPRLPAGTRPINRPVKKKNK